MKLYASLAIITATYAAALTLLITDNPQRVLWNSLVGALYSLALVTSTVPLVGPTLYETSLQILTPTLNPYIEVNPLLTVLKIASWAINITFTVALILYIIQRKRPLMRKIIKTLLI